MPEITDRRRRDRFERDYVLLAGCFAALMVLTNLIGTKLFLLFPDWLPEGFGSVTDYHYIVLTTGLVTYPLTFLFTDVVSEVWGRRRANHMVVLGFIASLLMLVVVQVAESVPRADRYWEDAAAQPVQGTRLLQAVPAGAVELPVDSAHELLLRPGDMARLAVLTGPASPPVVLGYNGLRQGQHSIPLTETDETTGATVTRQVTVPLRADQRGALQLTGAVADPLPAGAWVVPVASITQHHADGHLLVDRAAVLPPSGRLQTASGATVAYAWRGEDGALGVDQAALADLPPADLQPGAPLAVVNTFNQAELQMNMVSILAARGQLLFASMLAYLMAQFLDVWLYHFWRRVTGGRFLWLRNNGSTCISQLVDTVIVNYIFLTWAFNLPFDDVFKVIVAVYLVKMVLAWIDTPFIYLGVWLAKRRLGYGWHEDVDQDLLANQPSPGR